MKIESINLVNFKNYESLNLKFNKRINFILGNNGIGKTNILDAIHYLSFSKSFQKNVDRLNIKYGESFFSIRALFQKNELRQEVYLGFDQKRLKKIKVNDQFCERFSDHIGKFPVVMNTPFDSSLILDFSAVRRKFIDMLICQMDNIYLQKIMIYKRLLKQRNLLLKNKKINQDDITIYDERLSQTSLFIFKKRKEIINILREKVCYYYKIISDNEEVDLVYNSQLFEDELIFLLKKNLQKDQILNYTSCGVHRDDIDFFLKKNTFKKNASQGQQKSLILALRFAEFDILKENLNFNPLLLIDDLFDKLDENRIKKILLLIQNNFGQVFLTDTNKNRVNDILNQLEIEADCILIGDCK